MAFVCCRWRKLPGKVPGKDELRAGISYLHERLDKKEDTLLEKRLILEEIASLSHRLRTQAAEGRQDTLELAQKVSAVRMILRVQCLISGTQSSLSSSTHPARNKSSVGQAQANISLKHGG